MDKGLVDNKMAVINDLMSRGYNLCFIIDFLVNDYITNPVMLEFHKDLLKRYPDPLDTTQTFNRDETPAAEERKKPCRILHMTSRLSSTPKPSGTTTTGSTSQILSMHPTPNRPLESLT